jgi:hypothetical protein
LRFRLGEHATHVINRLGQPIRTKVPSGSDKANSYIPHAEDEIAESLGEPVDVF